MFSFSLQIVSADNLIEFFRQPTTMSETKTQGTNGVEPQCVHSPLPLLNAKNLLNTEVPKTCAPVGELLTLRGGGASCLCKGHIYFERNMGVRRLYYLSAVYLKFFFSIFNYIASNEGVIYELVKIWKETVTA